MNLNKKRQNILILMSGIYIISCSSRISLIRQQDNGFKCLKTQLAIGKSYNFNEKEYLKVLKDKIYKGDFLALEEYYTYVETSKDLLDENSKKR